jgi:predicted negative regulator of RcsB-dependent stress response
MDIDADSLLDMLSAKRREVGIAAIVIAAVGGSLFLWRQSNLKKEDNAERAFQTAATSFYSGNYALARTDLQKMVDRYSGTTAGLEGAMLLAQANYNEGKWPEGIKVLEAAQKSGAVGPFAASLEALIAIGFADQKKFEEAARHSQLAADKARFPADKDVFRADVARMLALAGKKEEARKIWAELAAKPDSPVWGEARVRLGELEATVATKN